MRKKGKLTALQKYSYASNLSNFCIMLGFYLANTKVKWYAYLNTFANKNRKMFIFPLYFDSPKEK